MVGAQRVWGAWLLPPIKPLVLQEPRLQLQHGRGSPCPPLVLSAASQALFLGSCFLSSWDPVLPVHTSCSPQTLCAHQSAPHPETPLTVSTVLPVAPPPSPWRPQSPVSAMIQTTWSGTHGWSSHRHSGQTFARLSENLDFSAFGFSSCRLGTAGLPSLSVDTLLSRDHITSREESHRKQRRTPDGTRESLHRTASSSGLPVQL